MTLIDSSWIREIHLSKPCKKCGHQIPYYINGGIEPNPESFCPVCSLLDIFKKEKEEQMSKKEATSDDKVLEIEILDRGPEYVTFRINYMREDLVTIGEALRSKNFDGYTIVSRDYPYWDGSYEIGLYGEDRSFDHAYISIENEVEEYVFGALKKWAEWVKTPKGYKEWVGNDVPSDKKVVTETPERHAF